MKEHEKQLNEAVRIFRLTDTTERPMIWGKLMEDGQYLELLKFTFTLGEAMFNTQDKRESPLTKEELTKMCLSSAKWSLEEYTTRKPALRGNI